MSAATHRPMPAPARPCAAAAAVIECNAAGAGRGLLPLVRLLQLASPALPVGAYTYSQGLEWAVESGLVRSEAEAAAWIGELLEWSLARFEVPLLGCQLAAWSRNEDAELARLNDDFLASRETAELRAETVQMGWSLRTLIAELGEFEAAARAPLDALADTSFPAAWTFAVAHWGIAPRDALLAYLWSWLENQVMAAVKAVPLGQTDGQRMLATLGDRIPALAAAALVLPETAWSNYTPGLAIASSRHETQYTRLFRS
jgi:urease accessory protein